MLDIIRLPLLEFQKFCYYLVAGTVPIYHFVITKHKYVIVNIKHI